MTFRARLIFTLAPIIALTTLGAFGAASYLVTRSEERQLDQALRYEAKEEAAEIAFEGRGRALQISDRGGPKADDVGRLTKYAVLYDERGAVRDRTDSFPRGGEPKLADLPEARGVPFDLQRSDARLRAILVGVPESESTLLLAASRDDLEKDIAFLWRVMFAMALLSIGCMGIAGWWVMRRLLRGHRAITDAARKMASGDLKARVALHEGDEEVVQLASDIDEMVQRLDALVEGQARFVAYAAHELRSPLAVLYGELQLALRRSRSAEEYRSAIEESLAAVKRLKLLSEDLLVVARTAAGRLEEAAARVSLEEVARDAAFWVAPDAERKGVTLDIDADPEVEVTFGRDLERLLRNLLDNAVRSSPPGGVIELRVWAVGDDVRFSVRDQGPGVAMEDRERVFEPFFRAAEERVHEKGSGLGLTIVREIARAHGGDVHIESGEGGRGAVFRGHLAITR